MKVIQYTRRTCVNRGTEERPKIEELSSYVEIPCKTQAVYDANYPIAEKEAVPGTINVTGEFAPEPEVPPTEAERITALEEALDMLLSGVTE